MPYQWLGEVAMALEHRIGGFDTTLLGRGGTHRGGVRVARGTTPAHRLHPILVGSVIALSLAAAGTHFHVRPHLFTLAAMAVVAVLLSDVDARARD